MRRLRAMVDGMNAPQASKWLIGIALTLVTLWLQAHLVLAALRDDGSTVRNAIVVYNSTEVRAQVDGAAEWIIGQGAALGVGGETTTALRSLVQTALASGPIPDAAADAIVDALVAARDDAVGQFDSDAATHELRIRLGPILAAFGIAVPPEIAQATGVSADLGIPIMDAGSMDTWRTRYHWAQLIDRWGLLAAAVALVVGVVLARRPLRAFSIALMAGGALCLLAIPLFGFLHDWLVGGGAGAWGPLVTPLATAAIAEVRPWLVPVGVTAIVAGAGLFVFVEVQARRAHPGGGVDDPRAVITSAGTTEPTAASDAATEPSPPVRVTEPSPPLDGLSRPGEPGYRLP